MHPVAIQAQYRAGRTQGTSSISTNQWTPLRELDALHCHTQTWYTYRRHCAHKSNGDIIALLGLYAPWNGNFLKTFRDNLSVPFSGTNSKRWGQQVVSKLGNCQSTVRETPGEGRSHLQGCERTKSPNLAQHADRPNSFKHRFSNFVGHGAISVSANSLRRPYANTNT